MKIVEACLADDFRVVPLDRFNHTFIRRARGILGIELSHGGTTERTAPTQKVDVVAMAGHGQEIEDQVCPSHPGRIPGRVLDLVVEHPELSLSHDDRLIPRS
ncbi:MAG: hypothetical protein OXH52_20105 [Gammaproteobacteria bacterium]|nr:hypothetical protein [Gammaproteobacteria bacterium]